MTEAVSSAGARREAFVAGSPVTEDMIHDLVHAFYDKVRKDPAIGLIFARVIAADEWPRHLAKMCDFWSSVTLMSGRFKGSPMQAHIKVGDIRPTHFARWLHLFQQTAEEVCPPEAAAVFIEKSQTIARSLQYGVQLARGEFDAVIADQG
jgi:hemoglobin